jgi:hypothetical protein
MPLLEPTESTLDDVAPLVGLGVERRRSAAAAAAGGAVLGLVGAFREDGADPVSAQGFPDGRVGVGLVRDQRRRPGSGHGTGRGVDADGIQLPDQPCQRPQLTRAASVKLDGVQCRPCCAESLSDVPPRLQARHLKVDPDGSVGVGNVGQRSLGAAIARLSITLRTCTSRFLPVAM